MLVDSSVALLLLVFGLGLKHGMDPDHLAAIDSLTRYNTHSNPRLSQAIGFLFSLGHGAVVIVVASLIGAFLENGRAPQWTKLSGDSISIIFLLGLGGLNLHAAWRADNGHFQMIGFRSTIFRRMLEIERPIFIVGIGALFAISFDTITQASLFSLAGAQATDWRYSLLLGVTFTLGMMAPDALNGFWIFRLARRADRRAPIASRTIGLTIGLISVSIGILELVQLLLPATGEFLEQSRLWIGVSVVAASTLGFWIAMRIPFTSPPTDPVLESEKAPDPRIGNMASQHKAER